MVQKFIANKGGVTSCNQRAIITDFETGKIFCGHCGFVLSERVEDLGPEWRSFSDDKIYRGRTGSGSSGLGT